MTPGRWYLAATCVLALIAAAVIDLAVVAGDSSPEPSAARRGTSATTSSPRSMETSVGTSAAPVSSTPPASSPSPTPSAPASTSPSSPAPSPSKSQPSALPQLSPLTLAIPKQDVQAPIDMCQIVDGGLQPPTDVRRTCYWAGGASVGAHSGTTVITGQCNVCGSDASVLGRIGRLSDGDTVFTAGGQGNVTSWRVTDVIFRPKSEGILPAAFAGPDGPRRLYLVTAGGPYVGGAYADNVYVRAVPSN